MFRSIIDGAAARWPRAFSFICQTFSVLIIWTFICLIGTLSGCSMLPYYPQIKAIADQGLATGISDRKEFNDNRLTVSLAVICDNSVGAVMRYPNATVRDFIMQQCGGSPAITADQLSRIAALLDYARRAPVPQPLPDATQAPATGPPEGVPVF